MTGIPNPEARLISLCVKPTFGVDDARNAQSILREGLNWPLFMKLARRHKVLPVVWSNLRTVPGDLADRQVREDLEKAFLANSARNAFLSREMFRIVDILAGHGVKALPWRGPALAVEAYGDINRRQFDDLDLLVRPTEIHSAIHALRAEGFEPPFELSVEELNSYLEAGNEHIATCSGGDYWVELQSAPSVARFGVEINMDDLWKTPRIVTVEGRAVESLAVEWNIMLLAVHGAKHQWNRIGWIADMAGLIKAHPALNWDLLVSHAREAGAFRMLLLGLELAGKLGGDGCLPEGIRASIKRNHVVSRLAEAVEVGHGMAVQRQTTLRDEVLFHLRVLDGFCARIRYLGRLAFTPTFGDWRSVTLPPWLFWLHRVIRPFRLMVKLAVGGEHERKVAGKSAV